SQGGADGFLGPRAPIPLADESWGCDFEGEVVVVTGDVPQGASREAALAAVRLVGLTNDVSLRNLIPGELAKGFG
ncbi:2-keto-4-pentenoate hydratase, partial [Staphylococcus aureus]|uniref:fumarylacetoacetate hydrolase family protein n=1 Tax=Staphylococcus aureus TaxID=1280 RepID=UPI00065BB18D